MELNEIVSTKKFKNTASLWNHIVALWLSISFNSFYTLYSVFDILIWVNLLKSLSALYFPLAFLYRWLCFTSRSFLLNAFLHWHLYYFALHRSFSAGFRFLLWSMNWSLIKILLSSPLLIAGWNKEIINSSRNYFRVFYSLH